MFSFLKRLPLHKLVVTEGQVAAQHMLEGVLRELPDLLLTCVVELQTGRVLASYTTHNSLNPNHLNLRYAKLLRAMPAAAWGSSPLLDLTAVLDDQLHHLRLLSTEQWYCFVAVRTVDANLALLKDVVRRCTSSRS